MLPHFVVESETAVSAMICPSSNVGGVVATPSPISKFAAWKIREDLMNEISMKNFHKRVKLYTFVV
jgi:hypothetical protein